MKYLVTDIETNGLLDTLTKFWCSWTYDSETNGYTPFTNFSEYVLF